MSRSGEVWRPVRGWPYAVSSHGRVRRSEDGPNDIYKAGYVISSYDGSAGSGPLGESHQVVRLNDNGATKKARVHRLVMEAFVGPCPEGHEIDHVNSIRDDNRLENLRYITRKQNRSQWGERNANSRITEGDVHKIRRWADEGVTYTEIAERIGTSFKTAWDVAKGNRWQHVD